MRWWQRLRAPDPDVKPGQSPGLFPVEHYNHRTWGIDLRVKEARAAGEEDARAGVLNQWTRAVKPPALRAIEAEREQNVEFVRGVTGMAVAEAEARAADAERQTEQVAIALEAAEADRVQAQANVAHFPEARHGWLSLPWYAVVVATILILGADVIFTQIALVNSLGFLPEWEGWTLSTLIGVLLLAVGVAEAYIETAVQQAHDQGERPPFNERAQKVLQLVIVIPAFTMLIALGAARFSLIDVQYLQGVQWIAAIGAFLAIVAAAILVAVVSYLGARILLAARPRGAARRDAKKATRLVAYLTQAHLAAQLAADQAKAHAQGTRPNYESAVRAAEEAWMQVICAYWRGFSLVRPDEQPDIDAINRITNASRPIHLDEVIA